MGFGSDLQGRSSHEALLRLQDTEIGLLENMKKCMTHRIKADREYTTALGTMILSAKKFENNEFQSPVFQAWNTVIHETENVIKLIQDNAEKMCTKTLEKIVQLINEKKAARKSYCEERKQLEQDFTRAQEEVQKCQQDYQRSIEKVTHDKVRYEDLYLRGRGGGKFDECKLKYQKSSMKLHKIHNDYVIAIKDVKLHQNFYLQTTLPALLDYQQTIQQTMVLQCKEILGEYTQLTDSSSANFQESFQAMHKCVASISPTAEYSSFLNQYKTDNLASTTFEFDSKLLDDYKGTLQMNEIALDNLTLEDLNHSRSTFDNQLAFTRSRRETKEKELALLEADMAALPDMDAMDDLQKTSYLAQERAVQLLKREIVVLNCQQQKFNQLFNMLDMPLKKLGEREPPLALELHELANDKDGSTNTSVSSSGGAKLKLDAIKNSLASTVTNMKMFKKQNSGNSSFPPKPGNDDVLADDDSQNLDKPYLPRTRSNASSSGYQPCVVDHRNGTQTPQRAGARRLEDEEWFHGVLPRDEVQRLLKDNGDYLVRESRNKKTGQAQYVLSVMWMNDYKHFIIQGAEGRWRFEGKDFATIQDLISNQHNSGLPVTNKSQAILRKEILKEEWELNNDDILLGDKLGNGNFGDVFKGEFRGIDVAVKTCRETLSEDQKKTFLQEGRILKQYDHPNIVKFIGIAATRQPVMIVMEYVSGGALLQFLRHQGRQQGTKQLIKMCEDASAGMSYLEDKNCIHRDLAARNCLVGKNNMVKISDFGMSREEEEYTVRDGLKQIPIKWTAPEALNYGKYTSLCDVWSFGILMWEIFSCGATPYPGMTNNQARDKIDMGYRMPAPESTPPMIHDLMQRCWEQQPENRPHFDEIHKELKTIHRQF